MMPRIAIAVRPSLVAALLLTLGLAVALQCRPHSRGPHIISILELPPSITSGLPPIQLGGVIVPPAHADARPWPHGMVMTPPPTPDAINLAPRFDLGQVVDTVLSVLLAPTPLAAL